MEAAERDAPKILDFMLKSESDCCDGKVRKRRLQRSPRLDNDSPVMKQHCVENLGRFDHTVQRTVLLNALSHKPLLKQSVKALKAILRKISECQDDDLSPMMLDIWLPFGLQAPIAERHQYPEIVIETYAD
jgi:hypothetical protein